MGWKLLDLLKRFVYKITSARFLIAIGLVWTFCVITMKSFDLFVQNLGKEQFAVVEKISLFLLGAFTTQVGNVIISYFKREDRNQENNNGNN